MEVILPPIPARINETTMEGNAGKDVLPAAGVGRQPTKRRDTKERKKTGKRTKGMFVPRLRGKQPFDPFAQTSSSSCPVVLALPAGCPPLLDASGRAGLPLGHWLARRTKGGYMKIRPLPLLVSAFALGAALFMGCRSEPPVPMGWYVATETVDLSAFLREPPTNSSPTTRAELDAMLALQQARTPEDLQRIRGDGPVGLRMFAGALGPNVRPEQLPATAALLSFAMDNAQAVINDAKARWQRPRPAALCLWWPRPRRPQRPSRRWRRLSCRRCPVSACRRRW